MPPGPRCRPSPGSSASQGLSVDSPNRLANRVSFHGTRAQVERTFHAEMHDYLVGGKTHFALATAPAIPAELESSVLGIHGLHDFHKISRRRRAPSVRPDFAVKNDTVLGPGDFATLYDTQPLLDSGNDGTGVTIAVVGQTAYPHSDITKFLQTFPDRNLTNNITDVLVPGTGDSAQNSDDDIGETDLDLEWASATAPGANIVFVYTGSDTDNYTVDDAVSYILDQGTSLVPGTGNGGAQILSESYGGCDLAGGSDADLAGETASVANLEGITYLAASGDDGSAGCIQFGIGGLSVGPPASDPGVTGVGGTEFPTAAQASPILHRPRRGAVPDQQRREPRDGVERPHHEHQDQRGRRRWRPEQHLPQAVLPGGRDPGGQRPRRARRVAHRLAGERPLLHGGGR